MERLFEGSGILWEIRGDTLYLTGSGDMEFRNRPDSDILDIPWYYLVFTRAEIQDGITSIGPEAFHTSDLVEISLPDSIRSIGPLAFCKCQDLKRVHIGKGVKVIPEYAFADCISLSEIEFSPEEIGYRAFENCISLEIIGLPEGLRTIGAEAFSGDSSLKTVTIPATVESIEGNPFSFCSNLKSVDVADGNTAYVSICGSLFDHGCKRLIAVPGITSGLSIPKETLGIGDYAFAGSRIESVTIPATLLTMGVGAFSCCGFLRSVSIGNVTAIPGNCFSDCDMLEDVDLGRCREIGPGAFSGCVSLERLILPGTLESVGQKAFRGCGLKEISFPESLMDIGEGAFYDCRELVKAILPFSMGDEEDYIPEGVEIEYLEQ